MTATTPRLKITYATLSADNPELQEAFDRAVERVRGELGKTVSHAHRLRAADLGRDLRASVPH